MGAATCNVQDGDPAKKIHLLLLAVEREASGLKHKLKSASSIRDEVVQLDKRAQELNRTLDD